EPPGPPSPPPLKPPLAPDPLPATSMYRVVPGVALSAPVTSAASLLPAPRPPRARTCSVGTPAGTTNVCSTPVGLNVRVISSALAGAVHIDSRPTKPAHAAAIRHKADRAPLAHPTPISRLPLTAL